MSPPHLTVGTSIWTQLPHPHFPGHQLVQQLLEQILQPDRIATGPGAPCGGTDSQPTSAAWQTMGIWTVEDLMMWRVFTSLPHLPLSPLSDPKMSIFSSS